MRENVLNNMIPYFYAHATFVTKANISEKETKCLIDRLLSYTKIKTYRNSVCYCVLLPAVEYKNN